MRNLATIINTAFLVAALIPAYGFGSDLATYYTFHVYDRNTKEAISGATISVIYKAINWGPGEGREWSNKTVTGKTDSSGLAKIYCLDYGHFGLFDISDDKFGPYAEAGLVIAEVVCEAPGYEKIDAIAGVKVHGYGDALHAGGSGRGEGLTFYLTKGSGGKRESGYEENRGAIKCWLDVEPNPASIPERYTVRWYIENTTARDVEVYYIMDGRNKITISKTAAAGRTTVLKSASGTTYTPGVFHHAPIIFHTSAGDIKAADYDFVVR